MISVWKDLHSKRRVVFCIEWSELMRTVCVSYFTVTGQ